MKCKYCSQEMKREIRTQILVEIDGDKKRETTFEQDGWWCINEDCLEEYITDNDYNTYKEAKEKLNSLPWL